MSDEFEESDRRAPGWWTRRFTQARMRAYFRHAIAGATSDDEGRVELDFEPSLGENREAAEVWLREHRDAIANQETSPQPQSVPPLQIVLLVVGTRGDIQPFLPIAHHLEQHGHRVRLATHEEFRDFVEGDGIEFFPLAADPRELIAYMVQTGGRIIPTKISQLRNDLPRKREMISEILGSTWQACIGPNPKDPTDNDFLADAVIANPPCFGHIHVAEALHVPLHMIFTMPWTPTTAFPHPLANLGTGTGGAVENWLSFLTIDFLTWAGSADLVNRFREDTLGIEPILLGEGGSSLLHDNEVPTTYLWSPSFVAKPPDWNESIEIAGFCFLDQATSYEPPRELSAFLEGGARPFYIGFGSCVIESPNETTKLISKAVEESGIRAILSRGWAGLGRGIDSNDILVVDDLPHDWLFPHLAGICHHGGAGTVAAGLRAGLPTIVVPFFGDQHFWGDRVARAGAGPEPIPFSKLSATALSDAFAFCLDDGIQAQARIIAAGIDSENGARDAVRSFHRHLPLREMVCTLDAEHLARRWCEDCEIHLCEACDALVHQDHERLDHVRGPWRWIDWGVRPPKNLVDGLEQGLGHAVGELFRSAQIAVKEPVEGAKRDGARGLAQGLGDGISGLLQGPVRGGLSLARKLAAAVEPEIATRDHSAAEVLRRPISPPEKPDDKEQQVLLERYRMLMRNRGKTA